MDAQGLTVALDVPPNVELLRASLTVQAPGEDVMVDVLPTATVATSRGPGPVPTNAPVQWFSVDWGARRALMFLQVKTREANVEGRLSIADGGPWYPPTPVTTVPLGDKDTTALPLPGILASRLMVEVFAPPANPVPPATGQKAVATVSSLVVKAAARPPDLTVHVETERPFFQHGLPLQPLQELTLRDDVSAALQQAWPADLKGGTVTLGLRAPAPSRLQRLGITLDTVTLTQVWSQGGDTLALPLTADEEGIGRVEIAPGQPLREVRFLARYQPRGERVPLSFPPPENPSQAHRCGAGLAAAQAFSSPEEGHALAGMDFHLRPLTRSVMGMVTLFPDEYGRPGTVPLAPGVAFTLDEQDPAPWDARWVSMALPKPLAFDATRNWWAVLTVAQGSLLWSLGDAASVGGASGLAPRASLYRTEDTGPWLEREVPSLRGPSDGAWAYSRPRLLTSCTEPAEPPQVILRWGTKQLPVKLDAHGWARLDERELAELAPPPVLATGSAPMLEVVVRSRVAGEITLSELRVTSPQRDTYALFQPS
ncbi:hypothetical protein A176_003515 [Myxococcus hansupus]|uniref:Uncharacterized protein n=1 Tax=Pseudomyxococcus hansupus TaxID=1297742 RepID=A0A0H4WYC3_9BACT|nr:hypothetical protein A176_003515 [Myxococcus hansupus]